MTKPANVDQFIGGAEAWMWERFVESYVGSLDDCSVTMKVETDHGMLLVTYLPNEEF